jgi:hypothetical protein
MYFFQSDYPNGHPANRTTLEAGLDRLIGIMERHMDRKEAKKALKIAKLGSKTGKSAPNC